MSIAATTVELEFTSVVVNVPFVVGIQTSGVRAEVYVSYGGAKLPAVQDVDYSLEFAVDLFTFNITPLTPLMDKIAADGTNVLYVGRRVIQTSDFDNDDAFVREKLVFEFDRVWMSLQEATFKLSDLQSGEDSATAAAVSAAAALVSELAAAVSAAAAAASAAAALASQISATASASTATTQASTATTQASTATTQATNAAASAVAAAASAVTAGTGATTATTQANTATTQATNAATSASTATTQAGTATTQAGTATTQAAAAAVSAAAAAQSAIDAANSAASASGDVVGPAGTVTADNPAVWNGTTGNIIKELTYAAFKTLLALVKGDVGLGNVDNTSDANKPVSTAQATADALKIAGPGAVTAGNPVTFSGTTGLAVAQITYAAFKTALSLVKGDVGLGSVDNTADTAKPVSTAQQTALDLKASLKLAGPTVVALTDGATPALDASLGNTFTLTAAGNRTIGIPTNPTNGQKIVIIHLASAADRTLALNTGAGGFRFGTSITALTATTNAKKDYIGAIYNGADSKWDVVAVSKGF